MTVVDDFRAVDPVAYITALGLQPEDSYGFLPLDVDDRASFIFVYRDRPEYGQARAGLPEASSVGTVDLGMVAFGTGRGREETGPSPELAHLTQMRDAGMLPEEHYQSALAAMGIAPPSPEALAPAAAPATPASDPNAPALVVHRIYPKVFKRSTSEQYDAFLPGYRDALGLSPEDVYGVWPRSVRQADDNAWAWDDYWLVYRDRPQYAAGRAAWDEAIMKPDGFGERMFSSITLDAWPAAELHPGVAAPGNGVAVAGQVRVDKDGWPRKMMVRRKRDGELGEELRARIGKLGYPPEAAFGLCPDFNGNAIFFAWQG